MQRELLLELRKGICLIQEDGFLLLLPKTIILIFKCILKTHKRKYCLKLNLLYGSHWTRLGRPTIFYTGTSTGVSGKEKEDEHS